MLYTLGKCQIGFALNNTILIYNSSTHAFMYASTYVCMYVRLHVCMYVCTYVCMYVCMHASMYYGYMFDVCYCYYKPPFKNDILLNIHFMSEVS